MRIDFSQLEKEDPELSSAPISNSNAFPLIWKNAFNKDKNGQLSVTQQEEQSLSFTVNYPYEVTRAISPSAINKELAYLQAKKILPTSTLRFIQNTLHAQLQRQQQKQSKERKTDQPPLKQLIITERLIQRQTETFNLTSKLKRISEDQNANNVKKAKKKKYQNIKPRVYDIKPKEMRDQKKRKDEDLSGVTLNPVLNYTMNSKTAKLIQQKRNHHFKAYQTNVFESLYYDAAIYSTKKQLKKMIIEQQNSQVQSRSTSRIRIYSTFEERLQTSIEKSANRREKAQNKLQFDLSTGQRLFTPNIERSKITYLTHFRHLSPHHPNDQAKTFRKTQNSRQSRKFNSSYQRSTTLNNSYEELMNNSLDNKYKITRKSLPMQNRLADMFAELVWAEQELKQEDLSRQQLQILNPFFQQIRSYHINQGKNINKGVFIAFFKEIYANLNMFDRSILNLRLKEQKNFRKMARINMGIARNIQIQTQTKKIPEKQQIFEESRLSHIGMQMFV